MKEKMKFALAALVFACSFVISTVTYADQCEDPQCTVRSDGCVWCCPLKQETSIACKYYNTAPPCYRDTTTCPPCDECGGGPGGILP